MSRPVTHQAGGGAAPVVAKRLELPMRFYRDVKAGHRDGRPVVELDAKPVRTPGKAVLALPNPALAEAVAAEWAGQGERIDPMTMPLTRLANTAVDGVLGKEAAVVADMARYAGSDLLCYRAGFPHQLVELQTHHWDPVLAWARTELGLSLRATIGVLHIAQPEDTAFKVEALLRGLPAFPLAALHSMTTLTGSVLLALAHARGRLSPMETWTAAHVDEDWQIQQWGEDSWAAKRRKDRSLEFDAAARTLALCWVA